MNHLLPEFRSLWACDFEFQPKAGELPRPICMVAKELKTGRTLRLWEDELKGLTTPPFSTGSDSLFIAYTATAEFSCFNSLGWQLPEYCLDLYVEFRNYTNLHCHRVPAGLISALVYFGQDALGYDEKEEMRNLAMCGGPFAPDDRTALLEYCESDVVALAKLLPLMLPYINLHQALLRGRAMKAMSVVEKHGIPLDADSLSKLKHYWSAVEDRLVERIDKDFKVFEGKSFKREKFEHYLINNGYSWPRTELGRLMLDEDTFHEMVRVYPQIAPIRELRHALSQFRLSGLTVGSDGRNRTFLSPFRASTGRNQPSNTESVFGPSCWIRGLIQPPEGYSVAYIDWAQQEFGIAAALSGDLKMMEAYRSGDPYLAFAIQSGAAPSAATKRTHGAIREQFKACVLAVQYGMGPDALAARIGQPRIHAKHLLTLHHETYSKFWRWSDAVVNHAMLTSRLRTVFGWSLQIGAMVNDRSLRNFPVQGNGSEMLRLACCLMVEAGVEVCMTVHDAVLVVAPTADIFETVKLSKKLMEEASAEVLGGFRLRSDEKIVSYPDRYMDDRGHTMWNEVWKLINEIKKENMS